MIKVYLSDKISQLGIFRLGGLAPLLYVNTSRPHGVVLRGTLECFYRAGISCGGIKVAILQKCWIAIIPIAF